MSKAAVLWGHAEEEMVPVQGRGQASGKQALCSVSSLSPMKHCTNSRGNKTRDEQDKVSQLFTGPKQGTIVPHGEFSSAFCF